MFQPPPASLTNLRILVVEDEYFIANDLARALQGAGAEVVGPASTVAGALSTLEAGHRIDGAVLDINLRGEMAYAVADALLARGVGFVFATGYGGEAIPARYAHVPRCEKPVGLSRLMGVLAG